MPLDCYILRMLKLSELLLNCDDLTPETLEKKMAEVNAFTVKACEIAQDFTRNPQGKYETNQPLS